MPGFGCDNPILTFAGGCCQGRRLTLLSYRWSQKFGYGKPLEHLPEDHYASVSLLTHNTKGNQNVRTVKNDRTEDVCVTWSNCNFAFIRISIFPNHVAKDTPLLLCSHLFYCRWRNIIDQELNCFVI